jgi:hypothetical protein
MRSPPKNGQSGVVIVEGRKSSVGKGHAVNVINTNSCAENDKKGILYLNRLAALQTDRGVSRVSEK